ncbi:DUF6233 domain-containing protein [Streptomyces virginiae]|uniref:DUF6233 domain-containing protein n=1 Tax=Streptomyces virginiae TaxID=1961 RepID=UPI00068CD657|nr:DUF6233 domain-containing protein [Streptomyces virginiae]
MSVLPPDLPRLQTLVTYLRGELGRAERALTAAEEREAAAVRQQPAPEPPAWLVERGIGAGRLPARLHTGDCWDTGKRHPTPGTQTAESGRRELDQAPCVCEGSGPVGPEWVSPPTT